jgi:phage FluMu protein Com
MGISARLTERIRGEFLEMPGLKLTAPQACRLWNANEAICREALDALVAEGFLRQTASGAFISLPTPARMLKANISPPTPAWRCPSCQHLNFVTLEEVGRPVRAPVALRCEACGKVVTLAAASA